MQRLFEVILCLKTKKCSEDIDLTNLKEEIQEVTPYFNMKSKNNNVIFITSIDRNRIHLIYKTTNQNKVSIKNLSFFLKLVHSKLRQLGLNSEKVTVSSERFQLISINHCKKIMDKIDVGNTKELQIEECIERIIEEGLETPKEYQRFEKGTESSTNCLNINNTIISDNDISDEFKGDWLKELNTLVGLSEIKRQIVELAKFINNMKIRNTKLNITSKDNYNLVIKGNEGVGKDTIAQILSKMFYHLGVSEDNNFIKIDRENLTGFRIIENSIKKYKSGVVYLDGIDVLINSSNNRFPRFNNQALNLANEFHKYKHQYTFIISGNDEAIDEFLNIKHLDNFFKFKFKIEDYTCEELVSYGKQLALKQRYSLNEEAIERLKEIIFFMKENNRLENMHTVKHLIDLAILHNGKRVDYSSITKKDRCSLTKKDFAWYEDIKVQDKPVIEQDAMSQLGNMIGMESVKERIKDIVDYAKVRKRRRDIGITNEPLCLHMMITGNPGTGKTTAARIIGKLLYQEGIIEKDIFVEASRENLVAEYVGQTATRTAKKIEEALGGVLFLDEIYSLYSDSNRDFGYEAVTTIVKHMEDKRNKLVVIFAGYNEEMKRFVNMNPGLSQRIQFMINFPDYHPNEMVEIFKKFCKDSDYMLDVGTKNLLTDLFSKIYRNRGINYANARLVRKCFDRVKIYQSRRIISGNIINKEQLMLVKEQDIKELYRDQDIQGFLEERKEDLKKRIGFMR